MSDSEPQREWRWPNHIVMSPSSLKAFGQCHFRNKLRYLQGVEAPEKWIRSFAMGNAAHAALGTVAQQMRAGVELITDDQVRMGARIRLPMTEYPSEEARNADIELVVRWVHRGRSWLESLHIEEFLLIEASERRPVKLFASEADYKLLAKPDLIVRRTNREGESIIHIIDYKTGGIYPEHDVPVIMRYVSREKLQQWTGDASAANVVFSWNWLDHGQVDDVDLTVEHCNSAWPGILEQMEAMAIETEWKATPAWHCNYCPYYQNYCPEEIPKTQGDYYE